MPHTLEEIEAAARELPEEEREILIQKLLDGLNPVQEEIDLLWIEECEKRYNEIISGKTKTITAEQVFSEIRTRLNANRKV